MQSSPLSPPQGSFSSIPKFEPPYPYYIVQPVGSLLTEQQQQKQQKPGQRRRKRGTMSAAIQAIGETLARLDDGDFAASLEVVDSYLTTSNDEDIAVSHSRGVAIEQAARQQSGYDTGDISSSGEFASFRDASSSPAWFSIRLPKTSSNRQSVSSATEAFSDTSVMQSLRRMVQREEAWQQTKATYENHLSQMALHLQQQSLAFKSAQAKLQIAGGCT
ncbi:hypothetical protein DL89DRAFT_93458 [Linderina pennispora]|uniref:Uncharacterized protein n=1 Tax=Linderina pennispora TaxID=61395 RepID=A0A1Y1VQ92_9FUNG|nr:uncharacterized protein DL89DRAFT_93458 [Linderina pennispora]ORX63447.1 hypothetical protein DL89DRAFT_93458 [Linderina pennispora]